MVRIYWAIRWFAWEFLALPTRRDPSSLLVAISRVAGCLVIYGVLRLALSGGVSAGSIAALIQCLSSAVLALALGNLARECVASVAAQLSVSLGREFRRRGATLNGRTYVETFHTDGTWMRCVIGLEDTVCEWTDAQGACNKVVTRPVRARRP